MPYTSISDSVFEQKVTLGEAYRIFEAFVARYNARGESSTAALMADMGVVARGQSADPAQLDDFLACAREVIAARGGVERDDELR